MLAKWFFVYDLPNSHEIGSRQSLYQITYVNELFVIDRSVAALFLPYVPLSLLLDVGKLSSYTVHTFLNVLQIDLKFLLSADED